MAEKKTIQIEKVEEQLQCSVCLDTYTDPKLLQCFHVYCQKCLVKLVDRNQQGQLFLSCPICRRATPVPANGVSGLQSAFLITPLLDMVKEQNNTATDPPASADGVEGESSRFALPVKIRCRYHIGKEVELFCDTCEEPICLECVIKSGKHFGHETELINVAFEKYKAEIAPSLKVLEKQLAISTQALAELSAYGGEISDQQAAIKVTIHDTFGRLQKVLDARKTELISNLQHISDRKLKNLEVLKDQIETTHAEQSSCLDFTRKSLETENNQKEVLMMRKAIANQVKELTTTFQPDVLKPDTKDDMIFSVPENFTRECQSYGQVFSLNMPDPSKCSATGGGLSAAKVGEKSIAVLKAIDFKGQLSVNMESLECELVSEITGFKVSGVLERGEDGQYEISYQPTIKGRHQLHIKVAGQHIRESPFSVAVTSPVQDLGAPIWTINEVKGPCSVAINKDEVIVSERRACCISVLNPSGEKLRSFGGQLDHATGVAVDAEGNILVADQWNHRILKFNNMGKLRTAVKGNGPLQYWNPRSIAINSKNGTIYVCDTLNNRIQVLNNSNLTFSSSFGKKGSSNGQFDRPYGIACDSAGSVYVADSNNHRIQVFTAEGKFLRKFGRRGEGMGQLMHPSGVAIDASGMVYVVERGNNRVSVFTSGGQHVTSSRSGEGKEGELNSPTEVAVDCNGVVYVCDSENNRLVLF